MLNSWKKMVVGASCSALISVPAVLRGRALDSADAHFLRMAAKTTLEVAHMGELAEHQASLQAVKDFGEELSNDHTTAYSEVSALAHKTGEKIPATLGDSKEINQLMRLTGAQFDSSFLRQEIQADRSAIAAFRNEAELGGNAGIKEWAKNMIPTLEGHLQTAERLAAQESTGK
jgi:putative membrane protein